VQQEMVSLAETRQDCFAVLDMPPNDQTVEAAITYVGSTLGVNSSYAAIYTPDVQVLDTANNQLIYAPPSGYIAGQYAYTDQNYAVWFSAAGYIRGVLNNVVGLYETYDSGDRTTLASYNINTIKASTSGSGNVIWDVLTLSSPLSLLSYVSVRRTFIYLEQSIIQVLNSYVFDNITSQTEFLITQAINNFLQPIMNAQGITNFYVLCNSVNNTANTIDNATLNVAVYIIPVVPARVIALTAIVTPNSISFQELISNGIT
jgi:phage tail sheath protein FI